MLVTTDIFHILLLNVSFEMEALNTPLTIGKRKTKLEQKLLALSLDKTLAMTGAFCSTPNIQPVTN